MGRSYRIANEGRFLLAGVGLGPLIGALFFVLAVLLADQTSVRSLQAIILVYVPAGLIFGYVLGFVPALVAIVICMAIARRRPILLAEIVVVAASVCTVGGLLAMGSKTSFDDPGSIFSNLVSAVAVSLSGVVASLVLVMLGRRMGILSPTA